LASKVELGASEKWEGLYPQKRGATVTIFDRGGSVSVEVDLAKGEPENPASWAELDKKFYNNARTLLSEEEAKRVSRTVMDLDHASLSQLVSLV